MKKKLQLLLHLPRIIKNLYIDYYVQHSFLGGTIKAISNARNDAKSTSSSKYSDIKRIFFKVIQIQKSDVIVDIGCGKGRVINYLLYKRIKNAIRGIELNKEVAESLASRLASYPNVQIIGGDVIENFPSDGTIFYMYNPFGETTMKLFIEKIKSLDHPFKILYYSPTHSSLFENDPVFHIQLIEDPELSYKLLLVRNR